MIYNRPWGTYEVLLDEPSYKVKRITVNPNQRLSLQFHNLREEHWTVVEGSGTVVIDDMNATALIGSRWVIPQRAIHRAIAHDEKFVFIETQLGDCDEDDIIRLEDDYGRLDNVISSTV